MPGLVLQPDAASARNGARALSVDGPATRLASQHLKLGLVEFGPGLGRKRPRNWVCMRSGVMSTSA